MASRLDQLEERLERRSEVAQAPPLLEALLGPAWGVGLEEVDRVCANAVARLGSPSTGAAAKRAILDVLDVLDEDRKVAIYYALAPESRRALDKDAAFAHAVACVHKAMGDALFDVETLEQLMTADALTGAMDDPASFARKLPRRFRSLVLRTLATA